MRNQLSKLKPERLQSLCDPIVAVFIAFVVSGLVVVISGGNPLEAYAAIARGAFGSATSFRNTLRYTFPILLLALSFNLCDKCGYFNIGQEGQMYASALTICWIQRLLGDLPQPLLMALMILGAMAAGGIVSLIPAALKFLLNINEVVVAILLNNLLISLSTYMLLYSGIAAPKSSVAKSLNIVPRLPLQAVLAASIGVLAAYALILRNTVPGFRLRMIGMNPAFARSNGLHTVKSMLMVAVLGGALAGLAASGEILSVYHETYSAYADGMGFTSMTAALIGRGSAAGMLLGSLLLGALSGGAVNLSISTNTPAEMVLVVRGFVMLFATVSLLQYFVRPRTGGPGRRRQSRREGAPRKEEA